MADFSPVPDEPPEQRREFTVRRAGRVPGGAVPGDGARP